MYDGIILKWTRINTQKLFCFHFFFEQAEMVIEISELVDSQFKLNELATIHSEEFDFTYKLGLDMLSAILHIYLLKL